jgi:predicted transcriptional regulator
VAVALVHEGKIEVKDVARLLDCSETVASNLVSGRTLSGALEGVRSTSRKRRTPARRLRIRDLIADGLSRDEVNSRLDETLTHQEFYYYRGKK